VIVESKVARAILMSVSASPDFARTSEWLERDVSRSKFPTMIIWGREDEVFDAATFSSRFKQMMSHAEGPHRVTGRHFLGRFGRPDRVADRQFSGSAGQ
jgi:pimeloyl-ACP methyl ester carboxylesterase